MADSTESTARPEPVHRPELSLGYTEPVPETPRAEPTVNERPTVARADEPVTQADARPSISERGPPVELRERPQWVAFRLVPDPNRPDKPKKIPFAAPQKPASTTDPATWLSYTDAVALAQHDGFAGVGYVFAPDDGITGIDLDGVRDPATGALAPWAWHTVREFSSYTEVSPSGKGLHILVRAELHAALKTANVEVYDRARYFTVTGKVLDGFETICEAQATVERLIARHQTKPKASATLPPARNTELSDDDLLREIASSRDAKALHRLYIAGDTRPNRSGSEDDFELALLFARQLGGDAERIERLMRQAAIARAKWDDQADYLPRTIRAALMRETGQATGTAPDTPSTVVEPLRRMSVAALAKNPALLASPPMLLPRLVWAGRGTLFAGREKDGKTTYAAWAVVQAAKDGFTVLWLSTDEDQATLVSRFVHLVEQGLGITDPAERDTILERIDVLDRDPASWEEVEALHDAGWRPDVYVVDTLSSFLMAVEGKVPETSEGERWQEKVKRFKTWVMNTAAGVLLLVHANRADGTYRGSTGIGAALDAIVTLYGGLSYAFCRRLERKGRFGIGGEKVTIRYLGDDHPGYEEVDAVAASADASDKTKGKDPLKGNRGFLYKVLNDAGGAGITEAEWRKEAEAKHSVNPTGSFNLARQWLDEQGYAVKRDSLWYTTAIS